MANVTTRNSRLPLHGEFGLLCRMLGAALDETQLHSPPLDIEASDEECIVRVDLPGVKKEDISLTVENDCLLIKASRSLPTRAESGRQLWNERTSGKYERGMELPFPVDPEQITASYQDGVLEIRCGIRAEAKPRQITIQ